eukprot:scaffold14529_cov117-Isochrysis_galbana.AAC.8
MVVRVVRDDEAAHLQVAGAAESGREAPERNSGVCMRAGYTRRARAGSPRWRRAPRLHAIRLEKLGQAPLVKLVVGHAVVAHNRLAGDGLLAAKGHAPQPSAVLEHKRALTVEHGRVGAKRGAKKGCRPISARNGLNHTRRHRRARCAAWVRRSRQQCRRGPSRHALLTQQQQPEVRPHPTMPRPPPRSALGR